MSWSHQSGTETNAQATHVRKGQLGPGSEYRYSCHYSQKANGFPPDGPRIRLGHEGDDLVRRQAGQLFSRRSRSKPLAQITPPIAEQMTRNRRAASYQPPIGLDAIRKASGRVEAVRGKHTPHGSCEQFLGIIRKPRSPSSLVRSHVRVGKYLQLAPMVTSAVGLLKLHHGKHGFRVPVIQLNP